MSQVQFAQSHLEGKFTSQVRAVLDRAARETIRYVHADLEAGVTVLLADDRYIQTLNLAYRGVDTPTDVLAFPGGEIDPDTGQLYLGDVIISLDSAQAQAAAGGHPLMSELQLLVVHGLLHLLGYDHVEDEGRCAMEAAQAQILTALGCELTGG